MKRSSQAYWEKRIQQQTDKAYARTVKQTQEELARIYKDTAEDLQAEILKVYAKVQDAAEGEVLVNDFYRNKRYWDLLDRMNECLSSLGKKQIEITEPAILELYEKTLETIEGEVPDTLKGLGTALSNFKTVDGKQALFQTWCLDGKNFSDRVWADKDSMLSELKRELSRCIVQGTSPWKSAESVAARLSVSENNAYRLLRTETAHAQIYAKVEKYKQYGITQARWIAASSCCEECQEHDGETYAIDKIQTMLPAHPNCRCSFAAVVPA